MTYLENSSNVHFSRSQTPCVQGNYHVQRPALSPAGVLIVGFISLLLLCITSYAGADTRDIPNRVSDIQESGIADTNAETHLANYVFKGE